MPCPNRALFSNALCLAVALTMTACGGPEEDPIEVREIVWSDDDSPLLGATDAVEDVSPDTIGRVVESGPRTAEDPLPEADPEADELDETPPDAWADTSAVQEEKEEPAGDDARGSLAPWSDTACAGVDDCSLERFPEAVLAAHNDCAPALACVNHECMIYCPPGQD